jgi:polyhydroxyalkanoate synthase
VLRETFASSGNNLVQGNGQSRARHDKSGAILSISQTDTEAFEVGRNIATSPGKVIFQNDIVQLIQYAPSRTALPAPLLIVPPWINKFYILDLGPQKSFIRYASAKASRYSSSPGSIPTPGWRTRPSKTT